YSAGGEDYFSSWLFEQKQAAVSLDVSLTHRCSSNFKSRDEAAAAIAANFTFAGTDFAAAGLRTVQKTKSACRTDGLQSVVITLYKWNPYLNRCQRNIQLKEVSCDKAGAKKGVCPEPRTVEPGSCNRRNNRQKTLVMHYEPDGKGGCVLHKDFAYPNCPKKKPGGKDDSDGCPEPRYYQKPCTGRHRQ
uniref:Secreted protein n=1 Tax=Macrostomum lignano TaxID=282301 RepID=A0A1I8JCP9_9PLAT